MGEPEPDPSELLGWPAGFFENVIGSLADVPMERGDQGTFSIVREENRKMIFDSLEHEKQYRGIHPGLDVAFDYIAKHDFAKDEPGKVVIDGERLFYTIATVQGKGEKGAKLEAHKRYIDIQFVLRGTDRIGLKPTAECQWDKNGFDTAKDIGFFDNASESWLILKPGLFVVLWPQDAHAPLSNHEEMHKVVFKVALDW